MTQLREIENAKQLVVQNATERSRTKRGQCQNAIDDVLLSKTKSGGYGTKEYYGTA